MAVRYDDVSQINGTITGKYDTDKRKLDQGLHVGNSFDLICREMDFGGKKSAFYFIDGMCKDEILQKLMQYFLDKKPEDVPADTQTLMQELIPYGETSTETQYCKLARDILAGIPVLLLDGYPAAFEVDFRTYPARSVEEPEKDKVMRGSRDGFVETLIFNTALIRRRIRNPQLAMDHFDVGRSSHTDVVLSYMEDRVDPAMLEKIRTQLQAIDIDSLTMNQESLAECLHPTHWLNPFPKFRFTERPDVAAASLLEGNIVILVDNSPSAMVIPTSVFDIIEDADDYYFPPVTGTYLRLSRVVINILAVVMTPLFILFMQHPEWIPEGFSFINITDPVNMPLWVQFLILEFAIDGLKLAALNTPNSLSTPLSVIAGIVLGDYTVGSGWFNEEVMLYMAFVAIANYTQSSFELGYALKFMRLILLMLTAWFGVYGFAGGILFTVFVIARNKTISGKCYIYPLIPFDLRQIARRFFRITLPRTEK